DTTLTQQQALDKIVADRQAGKGWGEIAHSLDLKLGHVINDVKKADKAADHIAGKPDKPEHVAKVDKPDKPAKPARAERPGRYPPSVIHTSAAGNPPRWFFFPLVRAPR